MCPKVVDGSWTGYSEGKGPNSFSPIDVGHWDKWRDYKESNAWQTTFGVQHAPAGLINLFGVVSLHRQTRRAVCNGLDTVRRRAGWMRRQAAKT
jgi:putative alpha-1,2-mannosidase